MVGWRTYLVVYFGTEGTRNAREIAEKLEILGFETRFGSVDFIYDWDMEPTKDQVLDLADKVVEALKGSGAVFNLDTHD